MSNYGHGDIYHMHAKKFRRLQSQSMWNWVSAQLIKEFEIILYNGYGAWANWHENMHAYTSVISAVFDGHILLFNKAIDKKKTT